ncbi:hypothetical protein F5884DRAFT_794086 [Xylogone sp. PMI_703]|nr:hypothetical protein F5884DRAFT_794086 [Xylogone sp. PMI_703]
MLLVIVMMMAMMVMMLTMRWRVPMAKSRINDLSYMAACLASVVGQSSRADRGEEMKQHILRTQREGDLERGTIMTGFALDPAAPEGPGDPR